jgi:hypothetical protein
VQLYPEADGYTITVELTTADIFISGTHADDIT